MFGRNPLISDGFTESLSKSVSFQDRSFSPPANGHWKTTPIGLSRLEKANRFAIKGNTLRFVAFWKDFPADPLGCVWADLSTGGFFGDEKLYVVQTDTRVIQRQIRSAGVLAASAGSGDAPATRSRDGRATFESDIKRGFVYRRVPHITLKSIANNEEIDAIHSEFAPRIEKALTALNKALGRVPTRRRVRGPGLQGMGSAEGTWTANQR